MYLILVAGLSSTGKTTFSKYLSEKLDIYFYIKRFYWCFEIPIEPFVNFYLCLKFELRNIAHHLGFLLKIHLQ